MHAKALIKMNTSSKQPMEYQRLSIEYGNTICSLVQARAVEHLLAFV
jgi:hypothetical protein